MKGRLVANTTVSTSLAARELAYKVRRRLNNTPADEVDEPNYLEFFIKVVEEEAHFYIRDLEASKVAS